MIFYVVELLDDWNVDVPSWKYSRNLESTRVSSPGFGNDSKSMVMRVDVTAQVAPELQRRMRTGIYLAVTAKRNRRRTASDLSRQLFSYHDSFKADREQTIRAHWSICSYACQMCSTYRNSLPPVINLE
ncbi:uncharacterized protein TNCV_1439871 [Trichonephila clavipes]|nr:uncharacterized protein TNCV_1439871 [Trichonephila clavipes]